MLPRLHSLAVVAFSVTLAVACASGAAPVDVNRTYFAVMEESKKNCRESKDILFREDSEYTQKAESYAHGIFMSDMGRWLSRNQAFGLRDDDYFFSHLGLRTFDSTDIETWVFNSRQPKAYICAHGVAYISSFFLDPDSPGYLSDEELDALIAHEFVHFRDGHVVLQRIAAAMRDQSQNSAIDIRDPNSRKPLSELINTHAKFAAHSIEYEADAGAMDILGQRRIPLTVYRDLLLKLRAIGDPKSRGMEFIVERLECVDRRIRQVKRQYWIAGEDVTKLMADPLIATDERRGEERFFLRYDSLLAKIFADDRLLEGRPPLGARLVDLTPQDIHSVCAISHALPRADDERMREMAKGLRKKILAWLDGNGSETLNEVLYDFDLN